MGGGHYTDMCCFDYGNAEDHIGADGAGTMESIYFGNSTQWWVKSDRAKYVHTKQGAERSSSHVTGTHVLRRVRLWSVWSSVGRRISVYDFAGFPARTPHGLCLPARTVGLTH